MNAFSASFLDGFAAYGILVLAKSTVILLFALAVMTMYRHNPAARHFTGLVALVAVACVPLLPSVSGGWKVPLYSLPTPETGGGTARTTTVETTRLNSNHSDTLPMAIDASDAGTLDSENEKESVAEQSVEPMPTGSGALAEAPRSSTKPVITAEVSPPNPAFRGTAGDNAPLLSRTLFRSAASLWLVGFLFLSAKLLIQSWRIRRVIAASKPLGDDRVLSLATRVAGELGMRKCPVIRLSTWVPVPAVVGPIRPVVLIPQTLLEQSSEAELAAILKHEFAHLFRCDLLVALAQRWLATLYWPQPLLFVLNRWLARSREELCDNHVLLTTPATDYATLLLRIGERLCVRPEFSQSLSFLHRNWSLEDRIAGILRHDRTVQTRCRPIVRLRVGFALLAVTAVTATLGVAREPKDMPTRQVAQTTQPAENKNAGVFSAVDIHDSKQLLSAVAARCQYWLSPASPKLRSVQYQFHLTDKIQPVKLTKGESKVRYGCWQGCSLKTGIHALLSDSDRFQSKLTVNKNEILVEAKLKDSASVIPIEVGNGIDGSWAGYFSKSTSEVVLTIDRQRMLPTIERSQSTIVRFSDWKQAEGDRWVPGVIDIQSENTHYRMYFDWMGECIWMLTHSESIGRDGPSTRSRTSDVVVNDTAVKREENERDQQLQQAREELTGYLDRNRPWLRQTLSELESIEYTFHTLRENAVEQCYVNNKQMVLFKIARDGQGKWGDSLGNLRTVDASGTIAMTSDELQYVKSSAKSVDQAEDLRRYASMGCQFDLPVFSYGRELGNAVIHFTDGQWQGTPCRVARVTRSGRNARLGAGTMLGFASWAYVHDIRPTEENLYIDPKTGKLLHETLRYLPFRSENEIVFEIDFGDWVEVTDKQWAPLSLRIEAENYFKADYRFQLVEKKHWMLAEVDCQLKDNEASRGVVENVRVNQPSPMHQIASQKLQATKRLFEGTPPVAEQTSAWALPCVFGRKVAAGPYRLTVTYMDGYKPVLRFESDQKLESTRLPVLLLDANGTVLFAPSVAIEPSDSGRKGVVELSYTNVLADIRFLVIPDVKGPEQKQIPSYRFQWGKPMDVVIPDQLDGLTRVRQLTVLRNPDGTSVAKLSVVSQDGPRQFLFDISVALIDDTGRVLCSRLLNSTLYVDRLPVEKTFDIDLGNVSDASKVVGAIISLTRGTVISQPMGSMWGQLSRYQPISQELLLASTEANCHLIAMEDLWRKMRLQDEFFERDWKRQQTIQRRGRQKQLGPHSVAFAKIVETATSPSVLTSACLLLGHGGDKERADSLLPMLEHVDDSVVDAAAVGLSLLARSEGIDRVRAVLDRETPPFDGPGGRDAYLAYDRLQTAAIIGLMTIGNDDAIRMLGEALLRDIDALAIPMKDQRGHRFVDRASRPKHIISLLGITDNPAAAGWLIKGNDRLTKHPEVAESFTRQEIMESLLAHEVQTGDYISQQLEGGVFPLSGIKSSKNPRYLPAVRTQLFAQGTTAWFAYKGINYLEGVDTPEALSTIQELYDRRRFAEDPRTWLYLCQLLAERGDNRMTEEAHAALVEAFTPIAEPEDPKLKKKLESHREYLKKGAQAVLFATDPELLSQFVQTKTPKTEAEKRALVELLWRLEQIPEPLLPQVRVWAQDTNPALAAQARKLLDR